jgi:hypothetical protein
MVQFFLKRSDSVLVSILKIRPSSNLVLANQNWNQHIWQSSYPPNTEHKPPWTWPSLTQKIPLQKQLQIPIDMRVALLLIRHCFKNSSLFCFVFGIHKSGDRLNQCVFCGKFWQCGHNKNQCKLYKGCFLGERKKQKSPYFEEKKKSHGAI